MRTTDVLVIGAGAAGLSASIYLGRSNLSSIIIDGNAPGGTLLNVHKIENYPGISSLSGFDLAMKFINQASEFGISVEFDQIQKIEAENEAFHVYGNEEYLAKAIIVATGMKVGARPVAGEKEHLGKGVSYCATCDGAFFREKEVALVGYSDRLAEEALYLAGIVSKVHILLTKTPAFSLEHDEAIKAHEKIEVYPSCKLLSIEGESNVTNIRYDQDGQEKSLAVSGVFPLDQEVSSTDFLYELNPKMEKGFLVTDSSMQTSVPGVFTAGDVVAKKLRQVVTAAGDAAIAATSAIAYVRMNNKSK